MCLKVPQGHTRNGNDGIFGKISWRLFSRDASLGVFRGLHVEEKKKTPLNLVRGCVLPYHPCDSLVVVIVLDGEGVC